MERRERSVGCAFTYAPFPAAFGDYVERRFWEEERKWCVPRGKRIARLLPRRCVACLVDNAAHPRRAGDSRTARMPRSQA